MQAPLHLSSKSEATVYPIDTAGRDRWILAQRPGAALEARKELDPWRPAGFLREEEPDGSGAMAAVTTIFLTNRECPWRCVECDLWRHTLAEPTPAGAIPAQIEYALEHLAAGGAQSGSGGRGAIKLYNAGSFFDPRAIPPEDHLAIAEAVRGFGRVIVECHPALIGDAVLRFRDLLNAELEVAMGLETAHAGVLEKLNKRLTLGQFRAAAEFLRSHGIALRVFILVQPPFERAGEALVWAERSLDFAFDCGAAATTLIPTRGGNGAMEALAASGDFAPPALATLEDAMEYGFGLGRGRVFADVWNLPRAFDCPGCREARVARLRGMNLSQTVTPRIGCEKCGGRS